MKIYRSLFHPDYKAEPYWWEAARPGTDHASNLPEQTEVFVSGSGYSGLSAGRKLSRNGRNVTVVYALAFGEAANSRNRGGVSAGVNIGKGLSGGPSQANREGGQVQRIEILLHESLAAYENVNTLIEREGIECHFERRGGFVGAFTPTHFEEMEKKA